MAPLARFLVQFFAFGNATKIFGQAENVTESSYLGKTNTSEGRRTKSGKGRKSQTSSTPSQVPSIALTFHPSMSASLTSEPTRSFSNFPTISDHPSSVPTTKSFATNSPTLIRQITLAPSFAPPPESLRGPKLPKSKQSPVRARNQPFKTKPGPSPSRLSNSASPTLTSISQRHSNSAGFDSRPIISGIDSNEEYGQSKAITAPALTATVSALFVFVILLIAVGRQSKKASLFYGNLFDDGDCKNFGSTNCPHKSGDNRIVKLYMKEEAEQKLCSRNQWTSEDYASEKGSINGDGIEVKLTGSTDDDSPSASSITNMISRNNSLPLRRYSTPDTVSL